MKRTIYFLMMPVLVLTLSCNQGNNNSSQQNFDSGENRRSGNFDPGTMAERQIEQMKETLDLSSEQADRMHGILMEGFENMRQMREEMQGQNGGFESMREQMREVREQQDEKIKTILSDEQWGKYKTFQEERRNSRRQRGGQQ